MRDTKIVTLQDRLRREEEAMEYCIRMTLPFADHLKVIRFLKGILHGMEVTR